MPIDLRLIKTIVIVMLENRSFDNLLGYLSCTEPYNWNNVEGLKASEAWRNGVANSYNGTKYPPFILTDPYHLIDADPPHERTNIALQMGRAVNGQFPLDGFIANYMMAKGAKVPSTNAPPPVMGYFTQEQAPVTDFFARNFAICDHWFSSLPAGTQPNRLMAMSGYSRIDTNCHVLPEHDLVYDWLTRNNVRWRVYHEGMPFFALMPEKWLDNILFDDEHFRPLEQLGNDIKNIDSLDDFPQVIFIEPTYTDSPHIGTSSDDHSPTGIRGGQEFLSTVYRCITQDPEFWSGTVMIVTYDEHGGFFDHISPPAVRTIPPVDAEYQNAFESLGIRVPAFVISPFVSPQYVHNGLLDHTSILKFIGQKFGKNGSYSDIVDNRPVGNVSEILNRPSPKQQQSPTMPSLDSYLAKEAHPGGYIPNTQPDTTIKQAFQTALDTIRDSERPQGKFDRLLNTFPAQPHNRT